MITSAARRLAATEAGLRPSALLFTVTAAVKDRTKLFFDLLLRQGRCTLVIV